MEYNVTGLVPELDYIPYLEFNLSARCRMKYNKASGWQAAGAEDPQSPKNRVAHPEGHKPGAFWVKNGINFKGVKITNTSRPPANQVVLSSMHKYLPRLVLVQVNSGARRDFIFNECEFIAVTAYQSDSVTALKVYNNKFAKGFREDGKANTKRKSELGEHLKRARRNKTRECYEKSISDREDEEIIDVVRVEEIKFPDLDAIRRIMAAQNTPRRELPRLAEPWNIYFNRFVADLRGITYRNSAYY